MQMIRSPSPGTMTNTKSVSSNQDLVTSSQTKKKTRGKVEQEVKSVLTQVFYKELVIIRYNEGKQRVLQETDFHHEFNKIRATDPYWSTVSSI